MRGAFHAGVAHQTRGEVLKERDLQVASTCQLVGCRNIFERFAVRLVKRHKCRALARRERNSNRIIAAYTDVFVLETNCTASITIFLSTALHIS
jgi:hypothetical protein